MDIEDMYRKVILDHARNPQYCEPLADADIKIGMANKLCGDELELTLNLDGDQISKAAVRARGCAMVIAASSLMAQYIRGKTAEQACLAGARFRALLEGETPGEDTDLEPLLGLLGMKDHRSRHRCVTLPWEALAEAFSGRDQGSENT